MINKNKYRRIQKALFYSAFLVTTLFVINACVTDPRQEVVTLSNLVLSEEFDIEGAPDAAVWDYDIGIGNADTGPGWGNNELQYYTDRTENVKVENGFLLITAIEEDFEGSAYTSARIKTQGLFEQQYGRFEARIKVPYGKGLWPAFWMLGNDCSQNFWPQCGEIDIMEYLGDSPNVIFGSVHGPGYSAGEAETKDFVLENDRFDTGFHIFGIEWGPDYINYYVDDKLYNQITPDDVPGEWVFDHPFYIILNVAVGGNFPGSPNEETVFPQSMVVDYVRVYN